MIQLRPRDFSGNGQLTAVVDAFDGDEKFFSATVITNDLSSRRGFALDAASRFYGGDGDSAAVESLAAELVAVLAALPMKPADLKPRTVRDIIAAYPTLRPYVLDGLVRIGEVMNLIAAPKMRKSYAMLDLAIAIASGRHWLNKFATARGHVLVIDNELHTETLAYRLGQVAGGRQVEVDEYADSVHLHSLRGRIQDIHQLRPFFKTIEPGTYKLIILDALYRLLPPDSENDNSAMAQVFNTLDSYADWLGCAFAIVHHTAKGLQGGKSVTDVGAGAGAQSRAADAHLTLREHDEEDCAVLDGVVRSFPPLPPLGLRWSYPVWHVDPFIDVSKIKRDKGAGGRPRKGEGEKQQEKPEAKAWTASEFTERFVRDEPTAKDLVVAKATAAGITGRDAARLILLAADEGLIHPHKFRGDRTPYFARQRQPAPGMRPDEAAKAVKLLIGLFPMQVIDKQAKFLTEEFGGFPFPIVRSAIKAHRAARDALDIPALLAECKAAADDGNLPNSFHSHARAPPTPPQ